MLLSIAGLKGGVGKTTLAACLALEGMSRGMRVLAIDLDPAGGLKGLFDAAAAMGHRVPPLAAVGAHGPTATWLEALAEGFDLAVLDCPPGDRDFLETALLASDVALLPTTPAQVDLFGLVRTGAVVRRMVRRNPRLHARVVLRARETAADRAAMWAQLRRVRIPVLETPVPTQTPAFIRNEDPTPVRGLLDEIADVPGPVAAALN